ncbi:hypothetical protein D3C78_1493500 [compost metagenome]
MQAAGSGGQQRCAVDHQRRRIALYAARSFVFALLYVDPRQNVVARAHRDRVRTAGNVLQQWQDGARRVGVVLLQRQSALQGRHLKALADGFRGQPALQCLQRECACVQIAFEELHARLPQLQADTALQLRWRKRLEQRHQLTPLTARLQGLRALLDELGLLRLA